MANRRVFTFHVTLLSAHNDRAELDTRLDLAGLGSSIQAGRSVANVGDTLSYPVDLDDEIVVHAPASVPYMLDLFSVDVLAQMYGDLLVEFTGDHKLAYDLMMCIAAYIDDKDAAVQATFDECLGTWLRGRTK